MNMGFDEIIALIINNGIGIACIVYFMFRDYKFMQRLSDLLSSLQTALDLIEKKEGDNDVGE